MHITGLAFTFCVRSVPATADGCFDKTISAHLRFDVLTFSTMSCASFGVDIKIFTGEFMTIFTMRLISFLHNWRDSSERIGLD